MGKNSKRNRRKRKQQQAEANRSLNGLTNQGRSSASETSAPPGISNDKVAKIRPEKDSVVSHSVGSVGGGRGENDHTRESGFGARKRKLANVGFVYAGRNGSSKPYAFGATKCGQSNGENSQTRNMKESEEEHLSPAKKSSQSLDDILFKKRKTELSQDLPPTKMAAQRAGQDTSPINRTDSESDESSTSASEPMARESTSTVDGKLSGYSVEQAVKDKVGCRPRANSTDGELNLPQRGLCDERKVLQSYKWDISRFAGGQSPPKGFMNLGNTCYLNSTLQCLAYLPPFCQSIMAMPSGEERGQVATKISQGKRITLMLRSLFRLVHSSKGSTGHALSPRAIVKAVPSLGSIGSRNGYKFRPGRQEDAHEFLVHLLDGLADGEFREAGINQHASGWRDRLPIPRLDETTFVHRIFGGYLRSQVLCTRCGHKSNTYDPFFDLSLEVSTKSCTSIATALQGFTRKETLDARNRWKCSGCKKLVCATKQLTVFRPPLSLCIPLKRFAYGGMGGGSFGAFGMGKYSAFGGGKKITKPIDFPGRLNLPLSDNRSCAYKLTGVVVHVGGSASSGHYTAFVRRPEKQGQGRWFHMDDSFVEAVSEKTVLRQKDAYVLFYCREEVALEFPQPPLKTSMTAEQAKELGRARSRARADSITDNHVPVAEVDQASDSPEGKPIDASQAHVDKVQVFGPTSRQEDSSDSSSSVGGDEGVSVPSDGGNDRKLEANSTTSGVTGDDTDSSDSTSSSSSSADGKTESDDSAPNSSKLGPFSLASDVPENDSVSSSSSSEDDETESDDPASSSRKVGPVANASAIQESDSVSSSGSSLPVDINTASRTPSSDEDEENSDEHACGDETRSKTMEGDATKTVTAAEQGVSPSSALSASINSGSEESASSSSEDGENSSATVDSNGISDDEASGSKSTTKPATKPSKPTISGNGPTRVVLDRGEGRGKVEVMLGPRYRTKAWKPAGVASARGNGFDLLGNVPVSTWDDDNDELSSAPESEVREKLIDQLRKTEADRKRKMFQDRWDSALDQGKTKKVKSKVQVVQAGGTAGNGPNPFQRIQASVQRMNKGRAKGYVRQQQTPRQKNHRR